MYMYTLNAEYRNVTIIESYNDIFEFMAMCAHYENDCACKRVTVTEESEATVIIDMPEMWGNYFVTILLTDGTYMSGNYGTYEEACNIIDNYRNNNDFHLGTVVDIHARTMLVAITKHA